MAKKPKAVTAAIAPCAEDEKWRIERDLQTIQEAHQIMSDPDRMRKVGDLAQTQMSVLQKVAQKAPATTKTKPAVKAAGKSPMPMMQSKKGVSRSVRSATRKSK
jgi:hypothetical protein